jgi:hypothetical protein
VREHGVSYSRFIYGLSRSNIVLDRKIMADLAVSEPYSFKSVVEEVNKQADLVSMMKRSPAYMKVTGMSYKQAIERVFSVRVSCPRNRPKRSKE